MFREAIFSSTDFSECHLTISYTDSKLYFELKIQSTEHNSSTIISAEYFTSVGMIVRMISVNSISAVYSIIHRNKRDNRSSEKCYERGAWSSFGNDVSLIQWNGDTSKKEKLVFSQQESNQWLVQLLYHRTAGDTLELRPEKKAPTCFHSSMLRHNKQQYSVHSSNLSQDQVLS